MKKHRQYILVALCFSISSQAQNLEDYFRQAAANNPGLQAQYKNFETALQRTAQVSSLPDPSLSFGYFISPVETRLGPQMARFSLKQMFPWFGTLKAQEKASSFLAEAKYQEFLEARNYLYYQVAAAYYPLYEWQRFTAIEEENLKILEVYKDITTLKFQNGQGEMVDVLRVDIMLQDASTNLAILKGKKTALTSRFNQLLNQAENEKVVLPDSLFILKIPAKYRKDSLLASNPLIDLLSLKIQASKAREEAAIKQGLPQLGLGLDYVIIGERSDVQIAENGKDALMPMVSVSLPIFRKKHKAARKEAQLMQESFTLQKEEAENKLRFSYNLIWFKIQEQLELVKLSQGQIKASKQSLNLLYTAYANSGKDFEDVLRMQRQILKYQKMKVTALAEYHIVMAELEYVTAKSY
jgi:cobalt-zinc-cadmium efflux system outer membrane protein